MLIFFHIMKKRNLTITVPDSETIEEQIKIANQRQTEGIRYAQSQITKALKTEKTEKTEKTKQTEKTEN